MNRLKPWLRLAAGHLKEAEAAFAVVGGLAVAVRTEPRFTRDIDFAVAADDDEEAERVLAVLIRYGYRPIAEMNRSDRKRLATMRLAPPGANVENLDVTVPIVDVIFSSAGIEREVVSDATLYSVFPGVKLPVAQLPHLIAMKLVSEGPHRRKDVIDLEDLVTKANEDQLTTVRRLLALITERGYHRDRDLLNTLETYVRDAKG